MKKIILVTCFFLLKGSFIYSQINNKTNFSIVIGPSLPVGSFAKTDLFDESAGFAKIGESVSLAFDKPFAKKISFLLNLSGQRNPINQTAFESTLSTAKIYQGFYFGSDPNNPPPQTNYTIYPDWQFEKSAWLYAALQAGGKVHFTLNRQKNIEFFVNATAGALYASSPSLKGYSITDTATAYLTQSKKQGFGFIFSVGSGLHYKLNDRYFLCSTLNYTGTNKVRFKNVTSTLTTTKGTYGTFDYSVQQSTTTANGQQNMGAINLLIGVGISF